MSSGVGIRAVHGARVGYAWSDDLDDRVPTRPRAPPLPWPRAAAGRSRSRSPASRRRVYYHVVQPLADVEIARKVDLVQRSDEAARAYRPAHHPGERRLAANHPRRIAIANTEGGYAEDDQDLCRLHVSVVAEGQDGERRTGSYGGGGRVGFAFYDTFRPEDVGAGGSAPGDRQRCGAVDAPAGPQTVVLAPGWSGILLHEAVGHGLEADFIRKGTSLYAGKIGEKVASDKVDRDRRRHHGQRARARSTSTTRASPASARCSSRTASSAATCSTRSTRS